jgi:CheY-like chemotaxis protein
MAEKILVADDSLTIQKVIAITLANTDYELVECLSHKELVSSLESNEFDLVLLDFNLSDSKTGYELGKEIKNLSSKTSILAMLGTFDSVDEGELAESGISDKIVKPFESEKFIQKCRSLIEGTTEEVEVDLDSSESFGSAETETEEIEEEIEEIGSDWVVDSPKPEDESSSTLEQDDQKPIVANFDDNVAKDALSEEMNSWGMEVPSVIGEETEFGVFPPKIEEHSEIIVDDGLDTALEELSDELSEEALPSESDLVYPEFDSTDDFSLEESDEGEEDEDVTDPSFEMPADFNSTEDLSSAIDEEIDGDDFWAVDAEDIEPTSEVESISEPLEEQVSTADNDLSFDKTTDLNDLEDIAEEEVDQIFTDLENEIDSEKESYHVEESIPAQNFSTPAAAVEFDSDEIISEVKSAITPVLEELVKKFCKDKIEQVAWEVIPDLAENLIKKEIKDIANSLEN